MFRKKTVFRRKNSHTGGGGVSPRGNFSHLIPFLFLKASLTLAMKKKKFHRKWKKWLKLAYTRHEKVFFPQKMEKSGLHWLWEVFFSQKMGKKWLTLAYTGHEKFFPTENGKKWFTLWSVVSVDYGVWVRIAISFHCTIYDVNIWHNSMVITLGSWCFSLIHCGVSIDYGVVCKDRIPPRIICTYIT